jgi:Ketopantoate reductase PanE/ApbA C terminal
MTARCSAPFFMSTWKRAGVVQREHADPGPAAGVRFHARRHREHPAARRGQGGAGCPAGVHGVVCRRPGGPGCGVAPGRAGCNTSSCWRALPGPGHRGRRVLEGLPCCCAPMPLPPPPIWRAACWPARPCATGWLARWGHGRERVIRLLGGRPRGCGQTGPAAGPGVIRHTGGPAGITFGELHGRASERAQRLLACCERAGFAAELPADIKTVLWAKLAGICAQAGMTAAVRLPIGEIRTAAAARAAFRRLVAEVCAVAEAEGHTVPQAARERAPWRWRRPCRAASPLCMTIWRPGAAWSWRPCTASSSAGPPSTAWPCPRRRRCTPSSSRGPSATSGPAAEPARTASRPALSSSTRPPPEPAPLRLGHGAWRRRTNGQRRDGAISMPIIYG